MPNYTFTASSCYALSTHHVTITSTKLTVVLTSTGQKVYEKNYQKGVDFMCQGNDFCIGTLADNGVFVRQVDFANPRAKLWVVEQSGANKVIGSNDENDSGIYNIYNLNQCPVRLISKNDVVSMECPCESATGDCTHQCYTYGN